MSLALAILVALIGAIFRSEVESGIPWLAERLRRFALHGFKGALRERLDEEWRGVLQEMPTPLSKLIAGIGFVVATGRIKIEYSNNAILAIIFLKTSNIFNLAAHCAGWPLNSKFDRAQFLNATKLDYTLMRTLRWLHVFKIDALEQAVQFASAADPTIEAQARENVAKLRELRAETIAGLGRLSHIETQAGAINLRIAVARKAMSPSQFKAFQQAISDAGTSD